MTATGRLRSFAGFLGATAAALLVLASTGCAFHVVHTPPLAARDLGTGEIRLVNYPAYVLVHDEQSAWDVHQIKNNVIGLFDGELIGWLDLAIDQTIPRRDRHPLQRSVEWIKNHYAQLPDVAPVRIVGGFFSALGLEKSTILGGVRIAKAPGDPISYFAFMRVVYLTDWVQDTLGEANTGLGYLVPWTGPFVPTAVTAPLNDAMDWAQFGAVTGYIYVFHQMDIGLDNVLYGTEWLWGGLVSLFVDDAEPVNQSTSQAGPDKP